MTRSRIAALTVTAALAGAVATAPAASADTQVIGSALALPMSIPGQVCTANCLSFQQAQVGGTGPLPIVSPANGIVTEWAVRTGDPDAIYTLRILRPAGTNTFLGAGGSAPQAPVPPGTTDSVIRYPAPSISIKQGDSIGILQTGAPEGLPQNTTNGVAANVIANNFGGLPLDGATAPFMPDVQHELLLQATVKFCKVPNLKGKKAGAARKALAAADCAAKLSRKPTKKDKNVGKVTKQKLKPGATAPPGTSVPIVVGKQAK